MSHHPSKGVRHIRSTMLASKLSWWQHPNCSNGQMMGAHPGTSLLLLTMWHLQLAPFCQAHLNCQPTGTKCIQCSSEVIAIKNGTVLPLDGSKPSQLPNLAISTQSPFKHAPLMTGQPIEMQRNGDVALPPQPIVMHIELWSATHFFSLFFVVSLWSIDFAAEKSQQQIWRHEQQLGATPSDLQHAKSLIGCCCGNETASQKKAAALAQPKINKIIGDACAIFHMIIKKIIAELTLKGLANATHSALSHNLVTVLESRCSHLQENGQLHHHPSPCQLSACVLGQWGHLQHMDWQRHLW